MCRDVALRRSFGRWWVLAILIWAACVVSGPADATPRRQGIVSSQVGDPDEPLGSGSRLGDPDTPGGGGSHRILGDPDEPESGGRVERFSAGDPDEPNGTTRLSGYPDTPGGKMRALEFCLWVLRTAWLR